MKLAWAIVCAGVAVARADGTGAGSGDACDARDPLGADVLGDRIAALAAPALDGRLPGTPGDAAARALIEAQFRCIGLEPAGDAAGGSGAAGYAQAFTAASGAATANELAVVRGTDADAGIVVVSAHHDHLGHGHLGANDDASGIAGLLAIAAAVHAHPPRRTVVFAAFGDEEDGMIGSRFFAAHPPAQLALDRVVQFVELDMIGSHDSAGLVAAMGAFAGSPQRAALDKLLPESRGIHVSAGGTARGSDFESLCAQGVPYTFFWTPDRRCYHRTCDTPDKIDLPHTADIARLAARLVQALADAPADLAAAKAKRGCGQRASFE